MRRRLLAVLLLVGFLATLAMAVRHNHLAPHAGQNADGCVYCSGALARSAPAPSVESPVVETEPDARPLPVAPVTRGVLLLDHSGCAPPLA